MGAQTLVEKHVKDVLADAQDAKQIVGLVEKDVLRDVILHAVVDVQIVLHNAKIVVVKLVLYHVNTTVNMTATAVAEAVKAAVVKIATTIAELVA